VIGLDHLWMLAAALALDAALGDPDLVWRRLPHPVVLIGRLIDLFDRLLNRRHLAPRTVKALGALAIFVVAAAAATIGYGLEAAFDALPSGWVGTILVAAVLLAGRSLHDHVAAVAAAFASGGIEAARIAVSRIVGRDPVSLDEAGVCRAAIESAAENFSDGVVAPAFWFAVLGLPGLCAYKAINTADSMIGHRTARHQHFGAAAARLDDLVNLPASRLAGGLLALAAPLAGGSVAAALRTMAAEAGRHRSPNAGWPEAAMASALGIALAGPRRYRGQLVDDPYVNAAGRKRATPDDIRRALRVYLGAWGLLFLVAAAAGGAVVRFGG
jgi:adenosylcobinamide-phosphate synthase